MLVAERTCVVEQLLKIVVVVAVVLLVDGSAGVVKLSVVWVVHDGMACLVEMVSAVERQLQALDYVDVDESGGTCRVAFTLVGVEQIVLYRVGVADERPVEACVHAVAVVKHGYAVGIGHHGFVAAAYVQRVDGGDTVGECPYVCCGDLVAFVGRTQ